MGERRRRRRATNRRRKLEGERERERRETTLRSARLLSSFKPLASSASLLASSSSSSLSRTFLVRHHYLHHVHHYSFLRRLRRSRAPTNFSSSSTSSSSRALPSRAKRTGTGVTTGLSPRPRSSFRELMRDTNLWSRGTRRCRMDGSPSHHRFPCRILRQRASRRISTTSRKRLGIKSHAPADLDAAHQAYEGRE